MDISIARQPILNKKQEIVAYEILYRGKNIGTDTFDGDIATVEVINNTLLNIGFSDVIDKGKAFFNFTSPLIKKELPMIFDKDKVVIEILEDVEPDAELIEKIRLLKNNGYTIALDDFVLNYPYEEILKLADIVKVDFLLTSIEERREIINRLNKYGPTLLAEKVETFEEFEEAKRLGCELFQGFFFEKPEKIIKEDIKAINSIYLLLLKELDKEYPNYNRLTDIIKRDFSLSYKFLKLVNSVAFYSRDKIESLERALVRLGLKEINKYIYVLMFKQISVGTPDVVIKTSIIRAKFCELLAEKSHRCKDSALFFMAGMFSLVDVIMKKSKEAALKELPLIPELKNAICCGEKNLFYDAIKLIELFERGLFDEADPYVEKFELDWSVVNNIYLEAIQWSQLLE